jgi:all-trans-retinol 13,14-reductase
MPKSTVTCLDKIELAPKIYLLKFGVDTLLDYIPGQFMSVEVAPKIYRSYSLMSYIKEESSTSEFKTQIEFLVNTRSGGDGSQAIEKTNSGDKFTALGPLGKFHLVENDRPKVFVATGTGLGPFVGMIDKTLKADPKTQITLFFGVYSSEYDYCRRFFEDFLDKAKYPNFNIVTCTDSLLENEIENDNLKLGKVTAVIPQMISDYTGTDFYICGNPFMVTDTEKLLLEKGATENVYTEKYGALPK